MAEPHPSPPSPHEPTRREPALDGLRGLAVLLVYLYHYGGGLHSEHIGGRLFGYLTETGWTGVVLFFVLSGFLITSGLLRSRGQPHLLRNFYARRALRILPLYFLSLGVAAVFALADSARYVEMKPLLVYAAFLQNLPHFVPLAAATPPPIPLYHLWSLAVEEQFYLLWPVLFLFAARRRSALALCLGLFVASALFRVLLWGHPVAEAIRASYAGSLPVHAGSLALGAALAVAFTHRATRGTWAALTRWAPLALAAGLLVYLVTGAATGTLDLKPALQIVLGLPATSLAATALILLAMRPGWLHGALGWLPLRFVGRISYGIYVFHILLEPVFDALAQRVTGLEYGPAFQGVRFLVALPISIAVAALSFFFFESPFLDLKGSFPVAPSTHTSA